MKTPLFSFFKSKQSKTKIKQKSYNKIIKKIKKEIKEQKDFECLFKQLLVIKANNALKRAGIDEIK